MGGAESGAIQFLTRMYALSSPTHPRNVFLIMGIDTLSLSQNVVGVIWSSGVTLPLFGFIVYQLSALSNH